MTATVTLAEACKQYGRVNAVQDVSLTLHAGETVALVGHNGAGKTTLIKLMLGLIRPTAGAVRVLGGDPARGSASARRRLGYLPESVSFHLALTGRETLAFYARLKRVGPKQADALFERVGLAPAAVDRPVHTYSKGMRQRLGLAQALLGEPRVLFLDEPTSGLDPALRRHFYDLIEELRAGGATVLLSSHALSELEGRTDRIVVLDSGTRVADGTLDDLRREARLPVRVQVRFTDGKGQAHRSFAGRDWTRTGAGSYETRVDAGDKIALLRAVTQAPDAIADLAIAEPTLDDLYVHFLGRAEAGR
ncbi:ABC transporter ATP-binding protein [Pseudochelatococcus lubricantis]|uniref:ABC transporter ATP-binding protein n=1 Tax=Pseudochelatococcus lubricantis TaxID=1538102 RepID=UPI0035EEA331